MNVKTDTKEKFHAITVLESTLSGNMTDRMADSLIPYLENEIKSVVLKLGQVDHIDVTAAEKLVQLQQRFYESSASFVVCEMKKEVETFLDENDLLEMMNVTPTESEAWDIVQMEEIERELMDDDNAYLAEE